MISFEDLWNKSEDFQKDMDLSNIIEELILKINLYKSFNNQLGIPKEEINKAKSRVMGEILLSITGLSLKDEINVYEALGLALHSRKAFT